MKSVFWQNGQRILRQILVWFQEGHHDNIRDRIKDYSRAGILKGLLNEFDIVVGPHDSSPSDPKITVRTGVAYVGSADRVIIPDEVLTYDINRLNHTSDDGLGGLVTTPQSTGNVDITLTANTINYVYLDYLLATDDSAYTLQKITNKKQYYLLTDGYIITVNTTGVPPSLSSLFLGTVDLTGNGNVSPTTIHKTGRTYSALSDYRVSVTTPRADRADITTSYPAQTSIFVDDHVKAVGTGTISPSNPHGLSPADIGLSSAASLEDHQRTLHASGIVGNSNSLQMQIVQVTPGFDFVVVNPLAGDEYVVVNGFTISSTDIASPTLISWNNLDPTGTYYIYVDRVNKAIERTSINLVANPDPNKLLLYSVFWTYPGGLGAGDGDLSNIGDYRLIGNISQQDVRDDLIAFILSKLDASEKTFEVMSYYNSGPDSGNIQTYDLYGNDDDDRLETLLGQYTFTNGSTLVTGVNTDFLFRLHPGDGISDNNRQYLGIVDTITDNLNLNLLQTWQGANSTTLSAVRFNYHVNVTYTYQNDPVFLGMRQLAVTVETFRFGSITFTRTTLYDYDGNGNLVAVSRQ